MKLHLPSTPLHYKIMLTYTDFKEEVDIETLKRQVRLDEERCRSQNIRDEYLFVIVIVKKPLLALRYQLPDGQVSTLCPNQMLS